MPGNVRRRSMYRLVKCFRKPVCRGRAQRRRRQHAERPRQHRSNIGKHVAEQIVSHDHIELLRPAYQLHCAGIGVHVRQLHVLVLIVANPLNLFSPKHAGFHDVRFLHGANLLVPAPRELECGSCNPADFVGRVSLGIDADASAFVVRRDAARFAEIDSRSELANDHYVQA